MGKKDKTPPPPPPNACISCMKRPAAPHNGGLCEVCAPPLNVPRTLAAMAARRFLLLGRLPVPARPAAALDYYQPGF